MDTFLVVNRSDRLECKKLERWGGQSCPAKATGDKSLSNGGKSSQPSTSARYNLHSLSVHPREEVKLTHPVPSPSPLPSFRGSVLART